MKHQYVVDRIRTNGYKRSELAKLRANAEAKLGEGDQDAQAVLDAIYQAEPIDDEIVFMGFCPDANLENRLDTQWKEAGICTFDYRESEHQLERFNKISPGDLVVLKKRHVFGKTMQLYGHGRVTGIKVDPKGNRYLVMNWSAQDEVIEVPLMACNSTVDVKTTEQVESEMPESFYTWLKG